LSDAPDSRARYLPPAQCCRVIHQKYIIIEDFLFRREFSAGERLSVRDFRSWIVRRRAVFVFRLFVHGFFAGERFSVQAFRSWIFRRRAIFVCRLFVRGIVRRCTIFPATGRDFLPASGFLCGIFVHGFFTGERFSVRDFRSWIFRR
jgi:hypothetical protein